jgi:hypothetical protein
MWDTAIRARLNKDLIPGIMNGESGDHYVKFLSGIQNIIEEYRIAENLPPNSIVAKKIDEYHYVRIVMTKKGPLQEKAKSKGKYMAPPNATKFNMPDNLRGRSIHERIIPTLCNLKNMLVGLKELQGDGALLKPWEKRSYDAYLIHKFEKEILNSQIEDWKGIIRRHILRSDPLELGASCIDIYLVAYVSDTIGPGKKEFFRYIKEKRISQKDNAIQAIWQVGKGDGVFLEILHKDGSIKDKEFIKKWINGEVDD